MLRRHTTLSIIPSSFLISSTRCISAAGSGKFTGSAWQGSGTSSSENSSSSSNSNSNYKSENNSNRNGTVYDEHTRYLMFRAALVKLFRGMLYAALLSEYFYPTVLLKFIYQMSEFFRAATNCDPEVAKTSPLPIDTFEVKRQQFIHEKLVSQAVQTQLLLEREKQKDLNNNSRNRQQQQQQQDPHHESPTRRIQMNPSSSSTSSTVSMSDHDDDTNNSSSTQQQQNSSSSFRREKDPLEKFPGIINSGGTVAPSYRSPAGSRNSASSDMLLDPSERRKGPYALKRELDARIKQIEEEATKKMELVLEQERAEETLQQKRNQVEATRQERRAAVEAGAVATEEVLKNEAIKKVAREEHDELILSPLAPGWARKKVHPVDVLHRRIATEIRRELEEFEHRQVRTFLTTRLRTGRADTNATTYATSPERPNL